MILNFNVNQQTVVLMKTSSVPRIGSKEYLVLQFSFSSDWENLNKFVYLQKEDVSESISIVDGKVEVPEWFTEQDSFNVTLFGTDGVVEIPTNIVSVRLERSNELWEKDAPKPQQSWFIAALESAEKAKASEDAAKLSETNAASSASSAQESAASASASALDASTSATAAAESKTSAIEAKTAAETAKTEAGKSASAAKQSEVASKASEMVAAESATAAKSAQSSAEAAKIAAAQSASGAAQYAQEAAGSASEASTSETNAKSSENAAKASENAAKASETAAKESETTAKSEADRAKSEADRAAGIADSVDVVPASTTLPKAPGEAAVGDENAFARGDHVHPRDNTKQDTLTGTEGQAVVFDAAGKAAAADTTEPELMDIPAGVLKGTSNGIRAAEAGKDYMGPVAVTAADNGKFLRVVNGAWAAASVADASGVSF